MAARKLEIRGNLENAYADVFTPEAVAALEALAGLDADRKAVMAARIERRAARARNKQRIAFLDPQATIARTKIKVQDARDGAFVGARFPRTSSASGFKAPVPRRSRMRRWKTASATSPTRCCRAPTAGCSTARTRSARSRPCRWTTSATSSWPSIAIRCS